MSLVNSSPAQGSTSEDASHKESNLVIRVPSNVLNAAEIDEKMSTHNVPASTTSSEDSEEEFKEGGYGW